ncbi:MAG TPA: twin-arginine translocase TatA/TatE family subunit [Bacillota bacterium]
MQLPGFWELIVIAGVALIIFGPRRLPEIGQALGKGIKEFRHAVRDVTEGAAEVEPGRQHRIKEAESPETPRREGQGDS